MDVLLTDRDAIERVGEVWRTLWERTQPRPPMLEREWIRQWWDLHGGEGELFLVLVTDEQREPIGLAPLYRRTDATGGLRTISMLGTGERERDEVTGEYTTWLGAPEAMAAISRQVGMRLGDRLGSWDRVQLQRLCPDKGIAKDLGRQLDGVVATSELSCEPTFRSPVMPLDRYLAALPSANFRHRCRRAVRAGKEAGLQLVRARGRSQRAALFGELRTLHQRRWVELGKAGAFASAVFTRFHERYLESARDEEVEIVALKDADRFLAVRYLLRAGDRLYDYLSGVDTTAPTALAPGLLLHLLTIDAGVQQGVAVYDLMAGDYDYKHKLALEVDQLHTFEAFAQTVRARLWLAARGIKRWVRRPGGEPAVAEAPRPPVADGVAA